MRADWRASAAWVALVALTLLSFAIGERSGAGRGDAPLLVMVAMLKFAIVLVCFMDIGSAGRPVEILIVVIGATIAAALTVLLMWGRPLALVLAAAGVI